AVWVLTCEYWDWRVTVMSLASPLFLEDKERISLWHRLVATIDDYQNDVALARVSPSFDPVHVRALLAAVDFKKPMSPDHAMDLVVHGLWQHQVHTPHPRYYGLFNPAPSSMGIAADVLVSTFNPQMAAWSHNPFAAEVEQHLVRALGARLGYD